MSSPRIAIIGAGPAGLTLARLLQCHDIPCTVFEYEQDRKARSQGGSLDLHEGSAQVAIKECGLFEQFMAVARPEGEVLKIYEPNGSLILDEGSDIGERRPDSFKGRPEVDRIQLRDIFIDSLKPETIQWGRKLRSVKTSSAGTTPTYDLQFDDHVETGFDLVIGADGAWSKVRHLLTDTRPYYSGISGLDVKLSSIDTVDADLSKRVGLGMCLTLGSNITVLSQRNGDGCVRTYGFMRGLTEDWPTTCGIDWTQPEEAKAAFIERHYDGFNDDSKNLILKADNDSVAPRPMYMLPIGHRWPHRDGLTLVGDAAHLMTPFAGVGVNVAMEDALKLGQSIIANKENLSVAVRGYEDEMFARAEGYAKETWMYLNLFFHERGGHAMVEHFAKAKQEQKKAEEGAQPKPQSIEVPGEKLPAVISTTAEIVQEQ